MHDLRELSRWRDQPGAIAEILSAQCIVIVIIFQGVNWRSMDALDCNAGLNPVPEGFNDGINLDPLEVLFVKVSSRPKYLRT